MYRLPYFQQLSEHIGHLTVRERYDQDRHETRLRSMKMLTGWLALFYFSYTLVDIYLLPDIALRSLAMRFLLMGPATLLLFSYYRRPVPIRQKELAGVLVVCLGTVVWCAILLGSQDPDVLGYFYAGLVFLLVITIVSTPPFEYSLYGSLFIFTCLYSMIFFLPGAHPDYVMNHLSLGVPVLVLSLMANYRFSSESLRLYLENTRVEQLRTELAARNAELEKMTYLDPLTGLANRRGLGRFASTLTQPDTPLAVAVIIVDVDHFKAFNDFYGHSEGDRCLRAVAGALQAACQGSGIVCRFGGEEFLVLSCEHATVANAVALAERIRLKVAHLGVPHAPTTEGKVTVSVGVCAGPVAPDAHIDRLIKAADDALYEAKREGRNRVRSGTLANPGSNVSPDETIGTQPTL
ncbi:GGDEF domain-containing protein [Vreelandella stevensii]|uniref:GGDEF domain-containing protein n=1 Tax=Vreelandella stevensii TaxID=502821 RepID=UPI0002FFBB2B|nr:GGDEF domain-containing protein [Halomonas stevensii]